MSLLCFHNFKNVNIDGHIGFQCNQTESNKFQQHCLKKIWQKKLNFKAPLLTFTEKISQIFLIKRKIFFSDREGI